jgi:N-acetylated-alpha-linked acidic dipeptidase
MRPRRTIVVCSWDGEEVGLTGSTEWGEQFAEELRKKAVAYINVDEATSGADFHGQAVASLAPMLVETSRTLEDPSGKTLYEAWRESSTRERREAKQSKEVTDANLADTRIGSGSDHTVFLNFVGMPVLGLGFEGPYGVYHSAYDDFFWMNHFGDPGYRYHALMSQLWGVLALRLANADLLPFDFASYAANIREFVDELSKNNTVILSEGAVPRSGAAAQSNDPSLSSGPTHLDLSAVRNAIDDFEAAGKRLNDSATRALASGAIDPKLAATINHGTMQVERNWLNPDGIPGRPWFKHILYGARFTYAHLELPGLTEAVEKQDWPVAKQQAEIIRQALINITKLVEGLSIKLANETREAASSK